MLEELHVENLLLIERAHLRLASGLNVLTGETGAGKTVLAHAVDLLLGGRPRSNIVRPGAAEAYVEGIFTVPAGALQGALRDSLEGAEGELVLGRRVGADGRTRAYVNGRAAAVSDLRELGGALVAFHGQHEHRRLLSPASQLEILDARCGEQHAARLRETECEWARARELEERLQALRALGATRERELDLLQHELAEIEALGEDLEQHERLLGSRERVRRLDALLGGTAAAAELLGSEGGEGRAGGRSRADAAELPAGAAACSAQAAGQLESLVGLDAELDALAARTAALTVEAAELSSELRSLGERLRDEALDSDEGGGNALDSIEQRLAAVERVLRKHGGSAASVQEHERAARERLQELSSAESIEEQAGRELEQARAALQRLFAELHKARVKAAAPFAKAVREQLAPLSMKGASFEVRVEAGEPGHSGADVVEFLIAPNRGVPAGPLREIASGGELSRVMLAILSAARAGARERTLVFDEVDAGIGGQTARAVGERLRALAGETQVICITHLPQIASLAQRHFTIVKDPSRDTARTAVLELGEQEVLGELARMLGADSADQAARDHARELLRAA